ncbi:MAG: RHS repeat-associated core domain-containing protein [Lacipirellulaceae bacterium]
MLVPGASPDVPEEPPVGASGYAFGGVYATSVAAKAAVVLTVTDSSFVRTRGVAIDSNVSAGFLRTGDPEAAIARYDVVPGGDSFVYSDAVARTPVDSLTPAELLTAKVGFKPATGTPSGPRKGSVTVTAVYDNGYKAPPRTIHFSSLAQPDTGVFYLNPTAVDNSGDLLLAAVFTVPLRKSTLTMERVLMEDPIGGMTLTKKEWTELNSSGVPVTREFFPPEGGSIVLYEADATIDDLTHHQMAAVGASGRGSIGAFRSELKVSDSRFVPTKRLGYFAAGGPTINAEASEVSVIDTVIAGNVGSTPIVIDANSKLLLDRSTLFNNSSHNSNRASVAVARPVAAAAIDVRVTQRGLGEASSGPGAGRSFDGSLTIRDSLIEGNSGLGGVILVDLTTWVEEAVVPSEGDQFGDPAAPKPNGAKPTFPAIGNRTPYRVVIDGSSIRDNWTGYGPHYTSVQAAITLKGGIDAVVSKTAIVGNYVASVGSGGGIAVVSARNLRIENSTIARNHSPEHGGGVYAENTDQLEIIGTTIVENVAEGQGGGLFVQSAGVGEPYKPFDDDAVTIVNSVVVGNTAKGSIVYPWSAGATTTWFGGRIVDGGVYATDSASTHDVWFSFGLTDRLGTPPAGPWTYIQRDSVVSAESRNNVFGTLPIPGPRPNPLPDPLPVTWDRLDEDRFRPLFVTQGANTVLGVQGAAAVQMAGLVPLADYGGRSPTYGLRTNSILLDKGFWNARTAGSTDELIKPRFADSSSYEADVDPAYNLLSESVTLTATDPIPDPPGVLDGRSWVSARDRDRDGNPLTIERDEFAETAVVFDLGERREIDRFIYWRSGKVGASPRQIRLSFWDDANKSWSRELEWSENPVTDPLQLAATVDPNSKSIVFNNTADVILLPGPPSLANPAIDINGYVATSRVRVTFVEVHGATYTPGASGALGAGGAVEVAEVRFAGKPVGDQRGAGFARNAGLGVDIGAFELPASWKGFQWTGTVPTATVTSWKDVVDVNVSTDVGANGNDGELSLREAILLANLHPNPPSVQQRVLLPTGVAAGNRFLLERGELLISDSLDVAPSAPTGRITIDAAKSHGFGERVAPTLGVTPDDSTVSVNDFVSGLPGKASLYLDPYGFERNMLPNGASGAGSRVLRIDDGATSKIAVELNRLEISGGLVQGYGGGVLSREDLTIRDSVVRDNAAHSMFVTYRYDGPSGVGDQRRYRGARPEVANPYGGGVYSEGGVLKLLGVNVIDNSSTRGGGGVYVASAALLEIEDSDLSRNVVRRTPRIERADYSTAEENLSTVFGGGLAVMDTASVSLTRTTVSGNVALHADEPIFDSLKGIHYFPVPLTLPDYDGNYTTSFGGGVYASNSGLTVTDSTIDNNEARHGGGVFVINDDPTTRELVIEQSTVSSNTARVRLFDDPGIRAGSNDIHEAFGGGIAVVGNTAARVQSSTVVENKAGLNGPAYHSAVNGGIYAPFDQASSDLRLSSLGDTTVFGWRLDVANSVVASNTVLKHVSDGVNASVVTEVPGDIGFDGIDRPRPPVYSGKPMYVLDESGQYIPGPQATCAFDRLLISGSIIGTNESLVAMDPGNGEYGYLQVSTLAGALPENWQVGSLAPVAIPNLIGGVGLSEKVNPRLDALAYNGGPTRTHAPLKSGTPSPAIFVGLPAAIPLLDQRGFQRDTLPDIGAHEYAARPSGTLPDLAMDASVVAPEVAEGIIPTGGIKVAELTVKNHIGAPLTFVVTSSTPTIVPASLFEVRRATLGRHTHEVWLQEGVTLDFETLPRPQGRALIDLTVQVTEIDSFTANVVNREAEADVGFEVRNLNELPLLPPEAPQLDVPRDAFTAGWEGVSVASLVAGARDDDGQSLGIAITKVDATLLDYGYVEYSTDSGARWRLVGDIAGGTVLLPMPTTLLLTPTTRLRVRPADASATRPVGKIEYRVWDQSVGAEWAGTRVKTTLVESSLSVVETSTEGRKDQIGVSVSRQLGNAVSITGGASATTVAVDVVGTSIHATTTNTGIVVRRYDAAGVKLGIDVAVAAAPGATNVRVAAWQDGAFVVVWSEGASLKAQRFSVSRPTPGGPFKTVTPDTAVTLSVPTSTIAVTSLSVSALASGDLLVGFGRGAATQSVTLFDKVWAPKLAVPVVLPTSGDVTVAASPSGDHLVAAVTPASGAPAFYKLDSVTLATTLVTRDPVTGEVPGAVADVSIVVPDTGAWAAVWRRSVGDETQVVRAQSEANDKWRVHAVTAPYTSTGGNGRRIDGVTATGSSSELAIAFVWTESSANVVQRRVVTTEWTDWTYANKKERSNQVLAASPTAWAQLEWRGTPDGRFTLVARETGGNVLMQRYAGDSPAATVLIERAVNTPEATVRLPSGVNAVAIATLRYGGEDFLAVDGVPTDFDLTGVTTLHVVGGEGAETFDLSRFDSPATAVRVAGGAGDDRYVLANGVVGAAITIDDAGGNDEVLVDSDEGDAPMRFLLGRTGRQTIGSGSDPADDHGVTLELTPGTTIEDVEGKPDRPVAPVVFRREEKPLSLLVDTTVDEVNLSNLSLSLREALLFASTDPQVDEIRLTGVEYVLGLGELEVLSDVVLVDHDTQTRTRITAAENQRVLRVDQGASLTVRDVDLRGTGTTGTVTGNGGVVESLGALTIERSRIESGSVTGDTGAGRGGAIYAVGKLRLQNVVVATSTASAHGGGVAFAGTSAQVFDSQIEGSNAPRGAGLAVLSGSVLIDGSTLYMNGLGIAAVGPAPAIPVAQKGGGVWQSPTAIVDVIRSTISTNKAASGAGVFVEAATVASPSPRLTITRSTIALNTATGSNSDVGAALNAVGAGVVAHGVLVVENNGPGNANVGSGTTFAGASSYNLVGGSAPGLPTGNNNQTTSTATDVVVDQPASQVGWNPRYHALTTSAVVPDPNPALNRIPHDHLFWSLLLDQRGQIPPVVTQQPTPAPVVPVRDNIDIGAVESVAETYTGPITLVADLSPQGVSENAAAGTLVATVRANPPVRRLDYRIVSGNASGAFAIDSRSGQITVADQSKLDYEGVKRFALRVEGVPVDGSASTTTPVTLAVVLSDVNEPPTFPGSYAFSVSESAINGETVGYVTPRDPEGSGLTFTLTGGDGAFGIDGSTGRVYVENSRKLRAVSVPPTVTVTVRDGVSSASTTVEIAVVASPSGVPTVTPPGTGGEVAVPTAPPTDFSVSHARELRFNPLAEAIPSATANYTVAIKGASFHLVYRPDGEVQRVGSNGGEPTNIAWGSSEELLVKQSTRGNLFVRKDGTFRYDPTNGLGTGTTPAQLGPGGAFVYEDDKVEYSIEVDGRAVGGERSFTVRVTNSFPVFRSEYTAQLDRGGANHLVLDETFEVLRQRSYEIDLANLLIDPDGDAVSIKKITSLQTPVNHDTNVTTVGEVHGAGVTGVNRLPTDPASSDPSATIPTLWTGIGYLVRRSSSMSNLDGVSALRRLDVRAQGPPASGPNTPGSLPPMSSVLTIHHDVTADDFSSAANGSFSTEVVSAKRSFVNSYSYEVEIGDSVKLPAGAKRATFEFTVEPDIDTVQVYRKQRPAWVDVVEQASVVLGTGDPLSLLDPANWLTEARDLQSPRGVDRRVEVGDALVDPVTGSLLRRHALALDGAGGESSQALPGLVYDSATAAPRAIVEARVALPPSFVLPNNSSTRTSESITSVTAKLKWRDHYRSLPQDDPDEVTIVRTGIALNEREWVFRFESPEVAVTGVYKWEVEFVVEARTTVNRIVTDTDTITFVQTGETAVVAQKKLRSTDFGSSPPVYWNQDPDFGDGWALEGAPQLTIGKAPTALTTDDRAVLWFPGESPRAFRVVPSGSVPTFVPIDTATGLRDPREYGVLRFRLAESSLPDRIEYTDGEDNLYVFEQDVNRALADATQSEVERYVPQWLLKRVQRPAAPGVIEFVYSPRTAPSSTVVIATPALEKIEYYAGGRSRNPESNNAVAWVEIGAWSSATGNASRALRVHDATVPNPSRLATLQRSTFTPVPSATDQTVRVRLVAVESPELPPADSPSTSVPDRVRGFEYDTSSRMIRDTWGTGDTRRVTSFEYSAATVPPTASSPLGGMIRRVVEGSASVTAPSGATVVASDFTPAAFRVVTTPATQGKPALVDRRAIVSRATDVVAGGSLRTEYVFDAEGGLVLLEEKLGATLLRDERWTRDHLGAATSHTDPLGRVSYFTHDYQTQVSYVGQTGDNGSDAEPKYDEDDFRGNVTRVVSPAGVTQYEYETDDWRAMGTLVKSVTPGGLTTRYERDNDTRRLKKVTRSIGEGAPLSVEEWEYDDLATATGVRLLPLSYTSALGLRTEYVYDSRGRVESAKTVDDGVQGVSGTAETTRTDYVYDAFGFVDTITTYAGDAAAAQQKLSVVNYDYDASGLLKREVVQNGVGAVLSEIDYRHRADGLVRLTTDGRDNETAYNYNLRGALTSVVEAQGDPEARTTAYSYYTDGRLRETILPDGLTAPTGTKVSKTYVLATTGLTETTTVVAVGAPAGGGVAGDTTINTATNAVGAVSFTKVNAVTVRRTDRAGRVVSEADNLTGAQVDYAYFDARHDAPTVVTEKVNLAGFVGSAAKTDVVSLLAYDAAGNVAYEKRADEAARAYVFDALGRMTGTRVLTSLGAELAYTHDAAGNVVTQTEQRKTPGASAPTKIVTDYQYDESGRLRRVKDTAETDAVERTAAIDYAFETLFGPVQPAGTPTTGPLGGKLREVKSTSREGFVTKQYVDAAGRVVGEENAAGGQTTNTFDLASNLTRTDFAPAGTPDDTPPDAATARVVVYAYDALNRVTTVTDHGATPASGAALVTTTQYPVGSVWDVITTEPSGRVVKQAYDALGNLVATREGTANELDSDATALVSRAYDAATGLTAVTTRQTSPRGESEIGSGSRAFDETRVSRRVENIRGDVLLEGVRRSDALGETDATLSGAFATRRFWDSPTAATVSYDVRAERAFDNAGRLARDIDADGDATTYAYDTTASGTGLVTSVDGPHRATVYYAYDSAGNRVRQAQEGDVKTWVYDALSRVTGETTTANVGGLAKATAVTRSGSYNGLVTTSVDRNGVTVTTTRTPDGRQVTVTAPGYTATYRYNSDGTLNEASDSWTAGDKNGDTSRVEYTYDEFGRVKTEKSRHTFNGVTAPEFLVDNTLRYGNGLRDTTTWSLRRTTGTPEVTPVIVATNTQAIDTRGRVAGLSQTMSNAAKWKGGLSLPGAKSVRLTLDADGRRDTLERFASGGTTGVAIGRSSYVYGADGSLERLAHSDGGNEATRRTFALHEYGRDEMGRAKGVRSDYSDGTGVRLHETASAYEFRSGLERVSGDTDDPTAPANEASYVLDTRGNAQALPGSPVYKEQNRLLSIRGGGRSYDAEGGLVRIDHAGDQLANTTYAWDHRGLLREASQVSGAALVEFHYDVLGRKVARRETNTTGVVIEHTAFAWDGGDLALEIDALATSPVVKRSYFAGPLVNETLATDEWTTTGWKTVWRFADEVGTVRSVGRLEGSTWKVLHRSLDAFGSAEDFFAKSTGLLGDTADAALLAAPVTFAGHQWDDDLALYDARARWYDPGTQRFLSEDPLGEAGGSTNLYHYAGGDPVNFVDPDGRVPIAIPALYAAGVYLGWQGAFSAGETGVEYAVTRRFGSQEDVESFSALGTFGKNFGINVATGGIGGKAKLAGRVAAYAARQGIEIGGDTAYDVGVSGRGLRESLLVNTVGSVVGEGVARGLVGGARAFHRNFEVSLDPSGVYLGSGLGGPGGLRITRRAGDPSDRLVEAFESRVDPSAFSDPVRRARVTQSQAYEDGLIGAASDVATQRRVVPALLYNNTNPRGKGYVRFDGADPTNQRELIDRKLNVTTKSGQIRALQRQEEAMKQNLGYSLRIEVPNTAAETAANRALRAARVDRNLFSVRVVP